MSTMKTFVLRVVIDSKEDIFRDIEIRADQNFEDLHESILHAFEFEGDQMASFYLSDDDWEKGQEIGLMDLSAFDGDDSTPSMKNTIFGDEVIDINDKVLYVYDFMKMWVFYVEVIEIGEVSDEKLYPAILREFGNAPEESSKEAPDLFEGIDLSKGDGEFDDDDEYGDSYDSYDDSYEDYGNF